MPVSGGRISALAAVRDTLAPEFSRQLDQISAGLIRAFSESDPQIPASLPAVEGLFLGTGTIPLPGSTSPGLASQIRLSDLADPDRGGSALLIRDGGFGGSAYVRNTQGLAGFQQRIAELADSIDLSQDFVDTGGSANTVSLKALTLQQSSWIEARRQEAQRSFDTAAATKVRAGDALGKISGISIDQEMATLLDLEKSYQASSKVLSVVNSMFSSLFEAVG